MLPQATRECSRVDSRNSRNLFFFEPRTERPLGAVVTVVADVVLHDETLYLDLARLVGTVDAFTRSGGWHAVIPESARLGMIRGRVSLQFSVARDGSVPKLVIAASSGVPALDRAAVAGISASNPFPPLPGDFNGQTVRLQFKFAYNMK